MTKIIGIPRMIGMTGDWDAKKTRMTRMTGITTIMDKNHIFCLGSVIKQCIRFEIFFL